MGYTFKLHSRISLNYEEGYKTVVNLSKHFQPTKAQITLLDRGLTFIPTLGLTSDRKRQLKLDLQDYHRRLKLESFFEGKKKTSPLPFIPKSDWTPRLNQLPPPIRQIIAADEYAFQQLNWGMKVDPNLEIEERLALKQLQTNKHIVIKPADKGNAIVIMDREQYLWEGLRQVNSSEHYTKLQNPIYPHTGSQVKTILDNLVKDGFINKKQREYLLGSDTPRPRRLYLLPKIHKDKAKWSKPGEIPPGRPIVSDCSSETYHIAEFIEYYLNPISQKHPSFLKDTYDFIEKVGKITIPPSALLCTIDIDSLYTNIETELGLEAVREWFSRYPDSARPDKYLLQLLEISLTKNDFEFDSQFYLQIKGTAMGKKFAPSYANIFMAKWEESALDTAALKPLHYFRFLDDIYIIWDHSKEEFVQFANHLNTHSQSIKIKYTIHETEVNFLDTITYKGTRFQQTGHLDFKVYFKDTDTHSLLFKTSYHPKHTYKGIVKSQLLRFHRICSDKEHFYEATKILFTALRKRGYSRSFLRKSLKNFLKIREKSNSESRIIPLVSTFSENSIQLNRLTKQNFGKFLKQTNVLQKHKVIAAYRRNRNLKDFLVKSKLPSLDPKQSGASEQFFQPKQWVTNRSTGFVYKLADTITRQSLNCIYLISCRKCNAQYVGQTKNTIMTRLYQHIYNIKNHKETNTHIVAHFLQHGLNSLRVCGLQSRHSWNLPERLAAERKWIIRLDTKFPKGLNDQ